MIRPQVGGPPRTAHPLLPELVGGLDLSASALEPQNDAAELGKMISNAEYWLSFDMAEFEPLLALCPSPLRELGVAVALRFGEDLAGHLTEADLAHAEVHLVEELPLHMRDGVQAGLETLRRAVQARDKKTEFLEDGFTEYAPKSQLSVHALRAMGKAHIQIESTNSKERRPKVPVGTPIEVSATDERKRPIDPPEIESPSQAPVLVQNGQVKSGRQTRRVVFLIPGIYTLRVPGRASGDRKIHVG